MKKLFAILLAVAMMATMAVSVFAENNGQITQNNGVQNIAVSGSYKPGAAADDRISVDVSWEGMTFTYTEDQAVYSPESHQTTKTGSWNQNKGSITLTNHSNVGIDATFSFTQAQLEGTTITGTFYDKSGDDVYTENTNKKISLVSGEDTTADGEGYTTPTGSIWFGIDSTSSAITADQTIGTITVTIAKTSAN